MPKLSAEDWCLLYKALITEIHNMKSFVAMHSEIAETVLPVIAKLENLQNRLGPGAYDMWPKETQTCESSDD